jgi:hypothetical protein
LAITTGDGSVIVVTSWWGKIKETTWTSESDSDGISEKYHTKGNVHLVP